MKRWLSIAVCLCLLFVWQGIEAGEIERIQQKGQIVVSLNKGYPPFAMKIKDQLTGLDVDLARLIATYLGVEAKFIQPAKYEEQIPKLLAGESDIIMAAMTRTVERALKVNFTKPYFDISQAALVKRKLLPSGAESYFDLTDIPNLRIGVKADTTHERFARELFPAEAIKTFLTAAEAAKALIEDKVDAMVADSPFVMVWRNTHLDYYPHIKALLAPVTKETYGFAIRKGDLEFLNWLNLFIEQIQNDGTMDLLIHEYFEVMAWANLPIAAGAKMTRANLMKNKFVARQRELIEQRRQAAQGGDAYE
jgi:polar amino acid transport system substrate-binding protein